MLTGESRLLSLAVDKLSADENESPNVGFMGTFLVEGEATAVVYHTGKHTAIGRIAKLRTGTKRKMGNLEKDLYIFSIMMLVYVLYLPYLRALWIQ